MKEKHTLAPWKVIGEKSNILITGKFVNGKDTYGMPIAYLQTEGNLPASMANAQLIATAPELLEVAEEVLRSATIETSIGLIEMAKNAIKKAEGRP